MGGHNVACYMNTGKREDQQDCIFLDGKIIQENMDAVTYAEMLPDSRVLLAVCDGMGGLRHGERASRFVCQMLKKELAGMKSGRASVTTILKRIQDEMERQEMRNTGSTVAGIVMDNNKTMIFNAGDSRVYKIAGGGIVRLSHDHSLVQSAIDSGHISEWESLHHPYRHVITFGMGDVFSELWSGNGRAYVREDILGQNEYYLICSDGLHDLLEDSEILEMLSPDPFDRLPEMISRIKDKMKDNLSLILAGSERN